MNTKGHNRNTKGHNMNTKGHNRNTKYITGTQRYITGTQRDITGTQRRGFKIFKQLQLQDRDKLKIDPITKTEWKEYYGKFWNEQGIEGEKGTKKGEK